MNSAIPTASFYRRSLPRAFAALLLILAFQSTTTYAAGTPVGTVIDNTAQVSFDLAGVSATENSNTTSITVVERIDVIVTVQTAQVLAAAGDLNRSLLFTLTNTGNGTETFTLAIDSNLPGDDFDPLPAVPPIYFDTDASGDFSAGDIAYTAGGNDPDLLADESVDLLLVNDIPGTALNGQIGLSQLTANSATGTGNPGDAFPGQGDGGVDAVLGSSGGTAAGSGQYLVSDVTMSIVKSVVVSDQFGGTEPIPGATLIYTITVEVSNSGTATNATFSDVVPVGTTYLSNSITLNGAPMSDATDGDAGELDNSGAPTVVVRLGDLTQLSPLQTVEFRTLID